MMKRLFPVVAVLLILALCIISCIPTSTPTLAPATEPAPKPTAVPAEEAAETDLAYLQTAVIALMIDNNLDELPNPVTVATNDMGAFPDTSVCGVDKIRDPNGNSYTAGHDKDGYILFQHDTIGGGTQTGLVSYLTVRYTKGTYTVDAGGTVTQVTTGYE